MSLKIKFSIICFSICFVLFTSVCSRQNDKNTPSSSGIDSNNVDKSTIKPAKVTKVSSIKYQKRTRSNSFAVANTDKVEQILKKHHMQYNKECGFSSNTYEAIMLARSLLNDSELSAEEKMGIILNHEWPMRAKPALIRLLISIGNDSSLNAYTRATAWNKCAEQYKYFYKYEKIIQAYKNAFSLYKTINDKQTLYELSQTLSKYIDNDKELIYLNKALSIAKELNMPKKELIKLKFMNAMHLSNLLRYEEAQTAFDELLHDFPEIQESSYFMRGYKSIKGKKEWMTIGPKSERYSNSLDELPGIRPDWETLFFTNPDAFKKLVTPIFDVLIKKEKEVVTMK